MSKNTIDTKLLQVRDIVALNKETNNFIASNCRPVVGDKGKVQWYTGEEFLDSIYISSISTNALTAIKDVPQIASTFVSQNELSTTVGNLSHIHKYINATTLYDCFTNLGCINAIHNELGLGSNISGGYVSTMNPGEYRVYQSTIPIIDTNLDMVDSSVNKTLSSAIINLTGFSDHYVNTSKLRIDIQGNVHHNFYNGLSNNCYVSTFLVNTSMNIRVGDVIKTRIHPSMSNTFLGPFSFYLSGSDIQMGLSSLILCHRYNTQNDDPCHFTTMIPTVGGVFVTLNNID